MMASNQEGNAPRTRESEDDEVMAVARIAREMQQLQPGDWELLSMCVLEEMSYEEIGAVLLLPAETVGQRIRQVRERLRLNVTSDPGPPTACAP